MDDVTLTLAQIEAFACVCECGTLTQAAKKLGKDRTTVRQLLDYLEIDLGYVLFDRNTRPLTLTASAKQLYSQARLLVHEAQAFSHVARHIPCQLNQRAVICYDPFIPRRFLTQLLARCTPQQISLDMLMVEREDAEQLLISGDAHLAICPAVSNAVHAQLRWRSLGGLSFAAYAREGFFADQTVSMLQLAARQQLVLHRTLPPSLEQSMQIAGSLVRVNEPLLLEQRLCAGEGWAFLPTHFAAERWPGIEKLDTEIGDSGLALSTVTLWKPGQVAPALLQQLLVHINAAWNE